jgi:hypothetical protein
MGDYIRHFRGQRDFCVHLNTSEKHFNAFKDVHKSVLACSNTLRRLRNVCVTIVLLARAKLMRIRTARRTPIPAKTTVAGENACEINMRVQISDKRMSYQANCSNCLGKSKKDVNGGVEPLGPSFIGTPGLIYPLDLLP